MNKEVENNLSIHTNLLLFLPPSQPMPNGFERTTLMACHPPIGKCHLQDEEYDADAETDGDATLGIQTQSVTEVQETADDGLRHIVGQTHLAIRYQPTLQGDGACPIQQQEDAHYGKHEKQIVP